MKTQVSYKDLDKKYRGRKDRYELNHIPPKGSLKGTPFAHIKSEDLPTIPMRFQDHR